MYQQLFNQNWGFLFNMYLYSKAGDGPVHVHVHVDEDKLGYSNGMYNYVCIIKI